MPLTSRCSRRCCDGCRGEDFEIQERGPLPGQGQGWTCYARGWSSVWAERVLSRKALPALRRFPAVLGLHHVREARPGRSLNCHCRSDDMWYCTQQRLPMSFQDKKLEYLRRNSKPLVPPGWMKPTIAAPIPTPLRPTVPKALKVLHGQRRRTQGVRQHKAKGAKSTSYTLCITSAREQLLRRRKESLRGRLPVVGGRSVQELGKEGLRILSPCHEAT